MVLTRRKLNSVRLRLHPTGNGSAATPPMAACDRSKRTASMPARGNRHVLTIAPNRSGKGTTAIVPHLQTFPGSVFVMDPKGELAKITAPRRGAGTASIHGMGQKVFIIDPWNIAQVPGIPQARFNPIDFVIADPKNATENAMLLADSIVPGRDAKEAFWDDEARALASGLILFVAFDPEEEGRRTLGRVREIITMGEEELAVVMARMLQTAHPVARSTAARFITKDEKLRSNVLATLQSHTHFLDSPYIRAATRASDFRFEDLKSEAVTIYICLPADRLHTFGRFLRILVQQAITVNARSIEVIPEYPVTFILDEAAALGRLAMVETAYGLMAGFGIQLWTIFQDASQAERIYGKGWQTFVGNSGVIQYFGSPDVMTSEYFSKLCGVTTMVKHSLSSAIVAPFTFMARLLFKGSELKPQTTTKDIVQRQLAYPDELMRMRDPDELLFVEGCNPIRARKLAWFDDPLRQHLGVNLFTAKATTAATSSPPPIAPVPEAAPRPQAMGGNARPAAA